MNIVINTKHSEINLIKDSSIGNVFDNRKIKDMLHSSSRVEKMNLTNQERYPNYCNDCVWKSRCGVCARELYIEYYEDKTKIGLCEFQCGIYESLLPLIYLNKSKVLDYLGLTDEN